MLSPHISLAFPEVVVDIETKADTLGWDAPPILLALFHRQPVTDLPLHLIEVEVTPFALDLRPAPRSGLAGVLNLLVDHIATPEAAPQVKDWLFDRQRTLIGYALVSEGFQYTPHADDAHGTVDRVPAEADAEVRIVAAIDTDLRYYQVTRIRGEGQQPVVVHHPLAPELNAGAIPDALSRLVTATHRL